ncbi:MAG: DnaJ domain-containing protein [Deltaproteobacteria bacterium]|nr:DnaJ domain-containing protein [Deltaproteobacteria bacterium]
MAAQPTPTEKKEASFELAANVDITRLPLTTEEGFVISRLAGRRLGVGDLTRETGLNTAQVKAHVESLLKKGAISLSVSKAAAPAKERDPYAGIVFTPGDLADGKDLTEEQKKRILLFEMNLDEWNHYTLLGIKRSASGADIKGGYFKSSKEFHPDAFFRKDLGKYAERVDRIFRAMKAAYDVISKPLMRAGYDETLVGELTPEELNELELIADEKKREVEYKARLARADENRKKQRLRWNPVAQRLAKARELFRLAEESRKAGKLEEAANHARLACSYDAALKVRAEPLLLEADAGRAQSLLKKIHAALQYGDKNLEEDVQRAADQAAELAEQLQRAPLLLDVAKVFQSLKRPQKAFKLASMATNLDDKLVAAWMIVADVAAAENKWALAGRAAERWLQLEPGNARAKDLVKAAKSAR